jgi:hypothetical protein
MTERCFHMDELASLLDLGPEDPRERHLAACPLCRARLAAYKAFVTEGPPLAGSRPEQAEKELDAFLAKMVHGDSGAREETGFWTKLRPRRIPRFVFVPGLAAAAVAVILLVVLNPFSGNQPQKMAPLRGIESPETGGAVLSTQPVVIEDGTVTFRWSPVPGPHSYEIQVFDATLEQIAFFEAKGDATLRVSIDQIPAAGGQLWWRVVAYHDGDESVHSQLSSLDLSKRPTE